MNLDSCGERCEFCNVRKFNALSPFLSQNLKLLLLEEEWLRGTLTCARAGSTPAQGSAWKGQ
jgi:hypothetical protein